MFLTHPSDVGMKPEKCSYLTLRVRRGRRVHTCH